MHVKLEPSNALNVYSAAKGASAPRPEPSSDTAEFTKAEGLKNALGGTGEMRSAEVERGRKLLAVGQYPPEEVILGLSRLLANHVRSDFKE
jgi:hypothetical protein